MKKLRYSVLNPLIFLVILWQILGYEMLNDVSFTHYGIYPREFGGLKGIIFWVFLHNDVTHLISNTVPLLVLGTAVYYFYDKLANSVILFIYLFTGIAVWIIGSEGRHIGASGLVYGLFGFLFFGGIFRRDKVSITLSLLVTILYGGIFWGILPGQPGVSWEGHLMGMTAGLFMAYYNRKQFLYKEQLSDNSVDFRRIPTHFNWQSSGVLRQTTNSIVMVRPWHFGFNPQTAESNAFQKTHVLIDDKNLNKLAIEEFDSMVGKLRFNGVNVMVFEDQIHKTLPDAVFPNNWISMHHSGKVVYYPMQAENRRMERREDILDLLLHEHGFSHTGLDNLSGFEEEGKYLEGTGSLVLDHQSRVAYAAISPRTNPEVFSKWCKVNEYYPVMFEASDASGGQIYHTNVIMSVGAGFVVVCLEVIRDEKYRAFIRDVFEKTGKTIIEITEDQMNGFCGNILQINNNLGEPLIVMSSTAFENFNEAQISTIQRFGKIIHSPIPTIETFGGGSARCMIAEVFLPKIG